MCMLLGAIKEWLEREKIKWNKLITRGEAGRRVQFNKFHPKKRHSPVFTEKLLVSYLNVCICVYFFLVQFILARIQVPFSCRRVEQSSNPRGGWVTNSAFRKTESSGSETREKLRENVENPRNTRKNIWHMGDEPNVSPMRCYLTSRFKLCQTQTHTSLPASVVFGFFEI